jgi:hypothetical protein
VPERVSGHSFSIGDESLSSLDTIRIAHAMRSTGMVASMRLKLALIGVAVFLFALLAAPVAGASPAWLAPVSVSAEGAGGRCAGGRCAGCRV